MNETLGQDGQLGKTASWVNLKIEPRMSLKKYQELCRNKPNIDKIKLNEIECVINGTRIPYEIHFVSCNFKKRVTETSSVNIVDGIG